MKSIVNFLILIIFVLLVLSGFIFTVHNTTEVPLWLGTGFLARPVGIWVLLAFIAGSLLGLLLGLSLWRRFNNHMELLQLRSRLLKAEKELAAARQQVSADQQGTDG